MLLNTYKLHQPILSNNKLLRAGIIKIKTIFEGKLKSGDAQTKERILDARCGGFIREFKMRRLRTTNYSWTSVVLCL